MENIKKNSASKQSIKEAQKFIAQTLSTVDSNHKFENNTKKQNYIVGDTVKIRDLNESGTIIKINKKTGDVIIDMNNITSLRMIYTAFSRAQYLNQIILIK